MEGSYKDQRGAFVPLDRPPNEIHWHGEGVLAVLAPGQGAQKPGMLTEWLEIPGAEGTAAASGIRKRLAARRFLNLVLMVLLHPGKWAGPLRFSACSWQRTQREAAGCASRRAYPMAAAQSSQSP